MCQLIIIQCTSSDTTIGTFTSGSDGTITTAFLSENKDYTLIEDTAPQGYHGLQEALTIRVKSNNHGTAEGSNGSTTVHVSGPEEYYILTQASGINPATLTIKNRPYIFRAIKEDGDTEAKLSGVHFELHKQVTVGGITVFDNAVMAGYEDLITDRDGILPKIDNTLPPGSYQLREKTSPSGYQALPGFIEFKVSDIGEISLLSSKPWIELTSSDSSGAAGTLVYTLIIKNYIDASVTIKKVDEKGADLLGSKFRLCKYKTSWEVVGEYSEIDLTKINQKVLTKLSAGRYRLEETLAPDGYVILTKYIYFNIAQNGTASLTDEAGTGDNSNENASISRTGNIITIRNTPGVALPSTGGPGKSLIYLMGIMLMGLAGAGFVLKKRRRTV